MKTMKDNALYSKCDVLLLADAFEKFKNNGLKNNKLCPSHYLSAPGLLELFPDPDLLWNYLYF